MNHSHAAPHVHVVRFAPAKLNLTLAVTGRRADGFHALYSIMVPLSLGDALTVRVAGPSATCDSLKVSGLPVTSEPDNLVLRAIAGARELVGRLHGPEDPPAHLATLLSKRIPVAAGLGGGSSDAAAAISAALGAWGVSIPDEVVADLAASLGSDVPFFQAGCGAVVTGRGEIVEPLPLLDDPPAVLLVTPRVHVSTAAVFRAYATGHRPPNDRSLRVSEAVTAEWRRNPTARTLLDRATELALANDLVPATMVTAPSLPDFTASVGRALDRPVCQSGSGPTLWILYPSLEDARRAGRTVRQAIATGAIPLIGDGEPFVAATLIAATSTAPGRGSSGPVPPDSSGSNGPPSGHPSSVRPAGPATIHNWPGGRRIPPDRPDGGPRTR